MKIKVVPFVTSLAIVAAVLISVQAVQAQNARVRIMAANITSGTQQSYEAPGIRIFQGLKPDIVAIQEFQVSGGSTSNALRGLIDTAFGTDFNFYVEPNNGIPNGVVSRYPILAAGFWTDTQVSDRGFVWAQIDLPGTNDLYVVSVHLHSSGGSSSRAIEATNLKSLIEAANWPSNAWIIVGGDFNTTSRSEACMTTFKTFLSDSPVPTDLVSGGNFNTSEPRSNPYDYLLPSFAMTNRLTSIVIGPQVFPNGLVFDSEVYNNNYTLVPVAPVQFGDSHVTGMQHMAVLKDFLIPTNSAPVNDPPAITAQPQSQTNSVGANISFSVTVTGTAPLAYQWRFYGSNISGATLASYALTNIQPTNAGDYTVVITNSFGSITSSVAALTVNASPFINNQPQSLSVNLGANAAFNVTAAGGTPLNYQWRFGGANIPGATASSYTRTNAQTVDAGNYTVVVTNYAGSVTSAVAVLTVNVTPPGVIAQWNFNSIVPDTNNATGVTTPSVGSGTAALVGGATATFATGDPTLDPAGSTDNSGWNSATYPAQGTGDKTRGVQFNVSTSGRQNILVTWATLDSNTGSRYSRLQYTTNGSTYLDFPTTTTNTITVFTAKTNSLAAVSGVNDNPNFGIRIVAEFESSATGNNNSNYVAAGTTYGTAGTVRFDMVTISGVPIVSGTAPTITNQPVSQSASQGDNITFTVGADGTAPLNYQWRFNLADIGGATSSSYTRSNVQPAHVGNYSVVVSNSAGFTTSSNANIILNIPQPVLIMPLAGVMQWQGLSNLTYTVQTRTNLAQTNWTTLGTAASPNVTISYTNTPATNAERYYRVIYP